MDYDYRSYHDMRQKHEIATAYILSAVGLVAMAASLFLITTIVRFKRLRTRTNVYILQLAILYVLCIICFICIMSFALSKARSRIIEMLAFTEMSLILMHVLFTFLLALDWFLTACKPHWMERFQKYYGYFHLAIYVLFLIEWIAGMCVYANPQHKVRVLSFIIVYFFIVMLLVLLNIFRGIINVKSAAIRTEYGFTIANITIFAYLPCLFHHIVYLISIFYDHTLVLEAAFYFITFLPYCIYLGHPIIVVYVLGYLNKYFKRAYNRSFRRVHDYSQEDLDELYLEETVEENGVPINFTNGKSQVVNI